MFRFRLSLLRKLSTWIILFLQLSIITTYFYLQSNDEKSTSKFVTFVNSEANNTDDKKTYHTGNVILKYLSTRHLFADFNSSLCYKNGTDIKLMRRSHKSWKCECLPGFHGNDCSQPEVIWRALLAYRKPLHIKGPRKLQRRIIYLFEINEITKTISDIRVNELNETVDLFILYEIGKPKSQIQLDNGFLKKFHKKILYVNILKLDYLWQQVRKNIKDIKDDDVIIVSTYNDIPNFYALQYFKLHNNWPEPVLFRLRKSVFGFFWMHPNKTVLQPGAFTVKYLNDALNNDLSLVFNNKTTNGFIIGDLNHFGGWFCEFCNDPGKIIEELNASPAKYAAVLDSKKILDVNYVEELIENGVYLDGKTELLRAHRFREQYFAPKFLMESSWKFDYLMINIYSKMDYYE